MSTLQWVSNRMPKTKDRYLQIMSLQNIQKAKCFHAGFPQYSQTPLVRLKQMARRLGLDGLFIKDESYRFGLNAFKVLGGSFAMACFIAKKLGRDVSELTYEVLTSPQLRKELGQFTFFTATDGNHGRGVAWAANKLGQKSVVLMPKGSSQTRLENIRKEGANATITEGNYDECVRMAAALSAQTPNSVVIQDTAWEGYEEIPGWIMQGYGTMAQEAAEQLKKDGCDRPTHIFIQAGVGSLASAVQGYFANLYPGRCPITIIVEPDQADCIYRSAAALDGNIRTVSGAMQTIMAGLACGEPNTIGWDILKNHSAFFVSCPDPVAAKGMRILGAPLPGDPRVISGESGAVTMGLVAEIMTNEALAEFRAQLGLNTDSRVLLFSTEGDTDPQNYLKIVHDGAYPSCKCPH
jgi:diaminopropionate ammonia-lyase